MIRPSSFHWHSGLRGHPNPNWYPHLVDFKLSLLSFDGGEDWIIHSRSACSLNIAVISLWLLPEHESSPLEENQLTVLCWLSLQNLPALPKNIHQKKETTPFPQLSACVCWGAVWRCGADWNGVLDLPGRGPWVWGNKTPRVTGKVWLHWAKTSKKPNPTEGDWCM